MPVDADGQFPANGALGGALAVGFVAFNQGLLAGLAELMASRGDPATSSTLLLASFVAGAATWIALASAQWFVGARRPVDSAVTVFSAGALAVAWVTVSPWWACLVTAGLIGWSGRRLIAG